MEEKQKTVAIGIRLPVELVEKLRKRAHDTGMTFNQLVNKALAEPFRSHHKKGGDA